MVHQLPVRIRQTDRFPTARQLEIGVQLVVFPDKIFVRGKNNDSAIRRQDCRERHLPLGRIAEIVREVPALQVDILRTAIVDFEKVGSVVVEVSVSVVVTGEYFANN